MIEFGFALREMWTLAHGLHQVPRMNQAGVPFARGKDIGDDDNISVVEGLQKLVEKDLCSAIHMRLIDGNQTALWITAARGSQRGGDGCRMMRIVINQHDVARLLIKG